MGIDAPASDQLASRQGSSCSCSCSLASLFLFLAVSLPFLTAANRSVMSPLAFAKGNSSQNLAFIFRVGMAYRASDLLGRVLSLEYFLSAYV